MSRWYDDHRRDRRIRDLERRLDVAEARDARQHDEVTDMLADVITDVVEINPGGACAATVRGDAA